MRPKELLFCVGIKKGFSKRMDDVGIVYQKNQFFYLKVLIKRGKPLRRYFSNCAYLFY